jgi:hypothetical protein
LLAHFEIHEDARDEKHTDVALAPEGGGTFSKTLKLFWSMICADSGTVRAKAQPTAALAARKTDVDGILRRN